jgi:hypothetical protein
MRILNHGVGCLLAAVLWAFFSGAAWADHPSTEPIGAEMPTSELSNSDVYEEEVKINNGEDLTRPLTRFDFRTKYQDLKDGARALTFTFRVDKPFQFDNGWSVSTRFDFPLTLKNAVANDNPNGDDQFGLGDDLLQFLAITPPLDSEKRWALGFGTRLVFPTATAEQLGSGKWQLAPIVGVRAFVPEVSKGSYVALLVRNQFSVAGDPNRRDINDLYVQPMFNWQLEDQWYVNFAPEMRFNLNDKGQAFVPFSVAIGKKINPGLVMSVEFKVPVIENYRQYDAEVEYRVGFFF